MKNYMIEIGMILVLLSIGFIGCVDVDIPEDLTDLSIKTFNVEPSIINEGETANLSWFVGGADNVIIDNEVGPVSLSGSRIIKPTETTIYILTAINETKTATATTEIIVRRIDNNEIPNIQFIQDVIGYTLTIASVEPSNLLWNNIDITGNCDISGLRDYVLVGDTIINCVGTISLRYIPKNTLLGTWKFQ